MSERKIIVVGAGLSGSLLAIRLAQRGFDVSVFEKRADMRSVEVEAGRSINLALSDRGLQALEVAGLKQKVLANTIPMRGRMIHPLRGEKFLSAYSGRAADHINSVSRAGLNSLLLDELDKFENVEIKFSTPVTSVDLRAASIQYSSGSGIKTESAELVIGTDGAGSAIRKSMMANGTELLFNYSQDFLGHGYKELSIHPGHGATWQIEKEALHIWPRGEFMVIALPNLDGSFTLTMFHPFDSEIGFNELTSDNKIQSFFETYYPTLLPYVPHYLEEFKDNPVGTLGTVKCFPWQAYGKVLILGDASHAIVPFYGQGMNASLEDVRVFDGLLDSHGHDWERLLTRFQNLRKKNTDAIADLAIDNFYEMRDHVDDEAFKQKRKIEMLLEKQYADYYSKYSLVTFQPDLSYHEAMVRGRLQDQMLLDICRDDHLKELPLHDIYQRLKAIEI